MICTWLFNWISSVFYSYCFYLSILLQQILFQKICITIHCNSIDLWSLKSQNAQNLSFWKLKFLHWKFTNKLIQTSILHYANINAAILQFTLKIACECEFAYRIQLPTDYGMYGEQRKSVCLGDFKHCRTLTLKIILLWNSSSYMCTKTDEFSFVRNWNANYPSNDVSVSIFFCSIRNDGLNHLYLRTFKD